MANYDLQLIQPSWIDYVYPNGSTAKVNNGSYTVFKHVNQVSSARTPNFKKIRPSQLPVNNYQRNYSSFDGNQGQLWCNISNASGSGLLTLYGGVESVGYDAGHIPWEDDISTRLNEKLLRSLNSSKASSLVTLAEAHKTAASIAKSATKIASGIRALRSLDFPRFFQVMGVTYNAKRIRYHQTRSNALMHDIFGPKWADSGRATRRYLRRQVMTKPQYGTRFNSFVADTWLEYSYAWKPLLGDVFDHAEAMATALTDRNKVAIRSVYASVVINRTLSSYTPGSNLWGCRKITEHVRRARGGVFYSLGSNSTLSTAATFGLTNPYVVAWELVPFSFVADWFIPIGDALSSLSASDGLVFYKGFVGGRNTSSTTTSAVRNGASINAGGYLHSGGGGIISPIYKSFSFTRFKLDGFPTAQLPRFKDPRSFAHAASAIALLQSIFLRK